MPRPKDRSRKSVRGGPASAGGRQRPPSGTRAVLFPAVLTLLPVLFFVLLEFVLRAAGYGVDTGLVLEVKEQGVHTYVLNPDVGRRYF